MLKPTTRSPRQTTRSLANAPGARWNQVRTPGSAGSGRFSKSSATGTQPAVVYSRSKNFAELYQAPRR